MYIQLKVYVLDYPSHTTCRGLKGADAFSTTVGGSNSSSFRLPGNVLLLPPGESVDATLLLKTPAAAMEAAAVLHGAIGSEAAGLDAAEVTAAVEQSKVMLSGALVVTAANGQQQVSHTAGVT